MKTSKKAVLVAVSAAGLSLLTAGCSKDLPAEPFDSNLRLTAGQVKMNVKVGETTQAQIFKALGAPNVVTLDSAAGEIWTYDQIRVRRTAQGYAAGAYFGTVFGFQDTQPYVERGELGRTSIGEGGASLSGSVDTVTTSINTATLIVRFDTAEKVTSYKMLVTSF